MKRKLGKSVISMVLAAVMCLSLLPMSASAMDYRDEETGTFVENGVLTQYGGVWGETDIVIPDGVTTIGAMVFWWNGKEITSITLPDTLTSIEHTAFTGCENLTSITIPNGVTSIEDDAFSGCTGLTSVTLPDSLTSIKYQVFKNCTSLTNLTIPNSVTKIESYAFFGCTSLTSVTLSNSLAYIGTSVFHGCTSLTSVTIPNSVTEIKSGVFRDCTSLASVTLSNSLTGIEGGTFSGCTSLTSVTIPESVISIGIAAFPVETTIKGVTGSAAEAYAKDSGNTFISTGGASTEPTTPTTPPTTDKPSAWAETQVNTAIAANIVPQALQGQYTQATTRAEFAALAVALYEKVKGAEIAERQTFSDTTDINVQKAAAIGVVSGVGNNNFAPNDKLTREQAATMLSRLATAIGKPLTEQAATFADNNKVSSWASAAVGQAQASGIMGGVGNNTFAPQDDYTREQSIITITRLFDIVK